MAIYCKASGHRWENDLTGMKEGDVTHCCVCTASAKKMHGHLVTIMCSELGCLNPAWGPGTKDQTIWVCDDHYAGETLI